MSHLLDNIYICSKNKVTLDDLCGIVAGKFSNITVKKTDNYKDIISKILINYRIFLIIVECSEFGDAELRLIKRIKAINPKAGIILITGEISNEITLKALRSSIYSILLKKNIKEYLNSVIYYFFKSFQRERINHEVIRYMTSSKTVYKIPCSLKYLPVITEHLTRDLPSKGLADDIRIDEIKIGLQEIIINAIEHGNLDISFDDKSKLLAGGNDIEDIIEQYSKKEKFIDRKVTITYSLKKDKVIYKVKDEGRGFNWKNVISKIGRSGNLLLEHGRGLFIANKYFDRLEFNDKGNEVTAEVHKT